MKVKKRVKQEQQTEHEDNQNENMDVLKVLIRHCNSIERLCAISKLQADFHNNALVCEICDSVDGGDSRQGRFRYDFLLGDDFSESSQPRAFINLKKSVYRPIGDA